MTIEARIEKLEARNLRVEADKAWETSPARIASIMIATYATVCLLLFVIGNGNPFRNALVPVLGYFLSTQSFPFLKRSWIRRFDARR